MRTPILVVAERLAHYVEGREKTESGFANAGQFQFPMREETSSSRRGVTDWLKPVPMF